MGWYGRAARMTQMRNVRRILVGNSEEKNDVGYLGLDGMIILKWFLKKCSVKVWSRFSWLTINSSGGFL